MPVTKPVTPSGGQSRAVLSQAKKMSKQQQKKGGVDMSRTQAQPQQGSHANNTEMAIEFANTAPESFRKNSLDSAGMSLMTAAGDESVVHLGSMQSDIMKNESIQQILKDGYHIAKMREDELKVEVLKEESVSHALYMQQALKVYAAISTLLYATISIQKTEDLEKFIVKRSASLPAGILNIEDWKVVMQTARQYRHAYSGIDPHSAVAMTMKRNGISDSGVRVMELPSISISGANTGTNGSGGDGINGFYGDTSG